MRKICILVVMIITNFCANYFTGENQVSVENVVQEQNMEVAIENLESTEEVENEIVNEVIESEADVITANEIQEKQQLSNVKQESVNTKVSKSMPNESVNTQTVTTPQVEPENNNSQSENVSEAPKEEPKQEPKTNEKTELQKDVPTQTNTQPTQATPTQSDLTYWCVEGGSHHVLGDGANEHGYYSSWNEADIACSNYIKDWLGEQHKIDQCACGLYYFWAIQN